MATVEPSFEPPVVAPVKSGLRGLTGAVIPLNDHSMSDHRSYANRKMRGAAGGRHVGPPSMHEFGSLGDASARGLRGGAIKGARSCAEEEAEAHMQLAAMVIGMPRAGL